MPAIHQSPAARSGRAAFDRRMMNVIIVDDEQAAGALCAEYCEAEAICAWSAIRRWRHGARGAFDRSRPQLLFLDIQMDPLNELNLPARWSVAAALAGVRHRYDTYAIERSRSAPWTTCSSPFDQERFRRTLDRVRPRMRSRAWTSAGVLPAMLAQLNASTLCGRGAAAPAGEFGGHLHVLEAAQVEMIEADRNYVGDSGGERQFPCAQHPAAGGTGAALAAHATHRRSCLVKMN